MGLFSRSEKKPKSKMSVVKSKSSVKKIATKKVVKKPISKQVKKTIPNKTSKKVVKKPVKKAVKKTPAKKKVAKKAISNKTSKTAVKKASAKKTVKKLVKKVVKKSVPKKVKKVVKKVPKKLHPSIAKQREHAKKLIPKKHKDKPLIAQYVKTGIEGLDDLLIQGIPRSSSILIAGGAGSGKTIMCLQILGHNLKINKKCMYVSFEESEARLESHMQDFKLNPKKYIKENKLALQRFNPFDIARSVDALLLKAKGELLIDIDPILFPIKFKPDIVIVDSLTAIASAFIGKEDSYRIYIEQLFRFFEKQGSTVFLITETEQVPTKFSTTGVEEFLADGVIVLYNIKRGNIRERAIEVLKLRSSNHQKKIVTFEIGAEGITVYPSQELFEDI